MPESNNPQGKLTSEINEVSLLDRLRGIQGADTHPWHSSWAGEAADEIERLTAALATCQTYDYRQIIDESDRLREALLASTAEVVQLQPDALRYRWLMADADRCHIIMCYAYAAWYSAVTWRETVEAESTKRGYALPAETGGNSDGA